MVYGAIIGDIVGSRFEFDRPGWTKDFELFTDECMFTDDTVMTLAVANALDLLDGKYEEEEVKTAVINQMRMWGDAFPNAGYGLNFGRWLHDQDPRPYNSFGNGSAMRVSAVGWKCKDLAATLEVARWTAEVTHNHPEGIKGAECTAAVVYLARQGESLERIKEFVEVCFEYDLSKSLDKLRAEHRHDESCQDTMPKALTAFFKATDFEDAIRNAVSLGGDADTIAAIAGSMAEAKWGVPNELKVRCREKLTNYLVHVVDALEE